MKMTGVRSWTIVVAGSLLIGGALTGCGGGGSTSTDSIAQGSSSSASGSVASASASASSAADAPAADVPAPAQSGVVQGGPGTVTLTWQPPTQYSDGTALAVAGYNIYYGSASQSYSQTIKVSNPGLATYVVDNLPAGTYYFAIAAYDSTGAQSNFSSEVAAAVN